MQAISHVPLATMSRLASLTLADIDPEQLRVAARLPAALEPRPQGVKVRIDRKTAKGGAHSEEFVLESVTQPSELAPLSKHQRAGTRLSIFRLSSADAGRAGTPGGDQPCSPVATPGQAKRSSPPVIRYL